MKKKKNKEVHIAQNGVTGAPTWSQAWGWGSQASTWWLDPEQVTWACPPVGSPPTGGFRRGRCCAIWVEVVGGGPDDPIPGR